MTQGYQLDQSSHYHSDSFKVSFIMFYLNMVDYPVFYTLLSTLTYNTFLNPTWLIND